MILCLDAGNSRLKWGLHDGRSWRGQGVLDHAAVFDLPAHLPLPPERVVACNVAGVAVAQRIEALAASLAIPLNWLASSDVACGISNGYARPAQLGADRWAALIGARALHAGPLVVVMAGTATTVDLLDADNRFLGGLILPGLRLMRAALARDTANLPFADGRYSEAPDNTDDAIVSGSLHATLGAIERMRAALDGVPTVMLSGGAAGELLALVSQPVRHIDNLVLEGLLRASGEMSPAP